MDTENTLCDGKGSYEVFVGQSWLSLSFDT